MIFHLSIAADRPERAARIIAEIWQGSAYPFPPFARGAWIAMAGDGCNSAIEVYPRGTEMHAAEGDGGVECRTGRPSRYGPSHSAIATPLSADEILAIARRNGLIAKVCDRGPFSVIEVWIDGCCLFEVLTEEMQADYLRNMTTEAWEQYLIGSALAAA